MLISTLHFEQTNFLQSSHMIRDERKNPKESPHKRQQFGPLSLACSFIFSTRSIRRPTRCLSADSISSLRRMTDMMAACSSGRRGSVVFVLLQPDLNLRILKRCYSILTNKNFSTKISAINIKYPG